MDSRQPQNSLTRPPSERSLTQNPNHQAPQPSQPQHFAAFAPAAQQQPVHVPYSTSTDPFPSSRRDPFLPTTAQHARRSSYGVHGGDANTPAQVERPRGWSTGPGIHAHTSAHSPPGAFAASSHDPPPPPPSFSRPNMPPPTSPQHNHTSHTQAQALRAPFASAFGANRSSMSISSLIGGENTPGSSSTSMQPPYRRQPSPERHVYGGSGSRVPEGRGYTAASPPRPYSNQGSPEQGRQSLPNLSQPYKPMMFQGTYPYASSPGDAHQREPRPSSTNMPPRPNSQPTGPSPPDQDGRATYDTPGSRRSLYGQVEERRRTLEGNSRPNAAELLGGAPVPSKTVQPVSSSAFSPPRGALATTQTPHSAWRPSVPEDGPRETTELRHEEQPAAYRGYGGYSSSSQSQTPYPKHASEDMVRGRSHDHLGQRVTEQYHVPPTSDPHTNDRQRAEYLSRSLSSGGAAYPGRSSYDPSRRPGDDFQHAKSFLTNLGPEANRRTGRASPLPQAVQGAQAQPLSIGKDPSIKSEFGRMFSGLGSGLGTSTPSRQSPMPQNGFEGPPPPGVDFNELRLQRVSSQNGRKPKRVKDEESVFDNESIDGRGTPSLRGSKRNKQNLAGHHHHHHAHTHHHHHHHHRQDDDAAPPTNSTLFNQARLSSGPQNGGSLQPSHHHHHYHAAPHHHHHAPRANQAGSLPSPKLPPKIHDIQAVLKEAAKHPRKHLGSYLYEATPELPAPNSSLDDQFSYASKPRPLPRFERNPINCTVTIRVPRYYLKPRQRQQIVLQRHLWGASIYRDDSDAIAAAIHSGWIRGEWDDTVDVSMLDPRVTIPNDPGDAQDVLTQKPAAPVTPPAEMDLQIDLLILPKIQEYVATVEYGISSRKSKNHDGISFMIYQVRWVEEGVGSRGQERGAAAMKRRLDASTALLSLMNGGEDALRAVKGTAKLRA